MEAFLSALLITGVVAVVTQIAKKIKWVNGLGDYGIQSLVLVFAILIALLELGWTFVPTQYAQIVVMVWAGAIGWYEIVIKKFTSKG